MIANDLTLPQMGWSAYFQSQLSVEDTETLTPRRVREVHRNSLQTLGQTGTARLEMTAELTAQGVAVGDWLLTDETGGCPARVLARKSLLARRAAGDAPSAQLIAANVDTLFIVSSCNADFNIARLERYLALAHQGDIDPLVILTKADLCEDPGDFRARARTALHGVLVETVVATDPGVAAQLAPWCSHGQSVALLGSSGVGKTTLINALTGAGAATQSIREDDAKGRHTTTRRSMFRTRTGGWVIDTPGMRSLRLADMAQGIEAVFADIAELAQQCKFSDCAHAGEPGCAVQAAISAGNLDAARLARWQKLTSEDARHSATLAQVRRRARDTERTYKSGKARGEAKKRGYPSDR